jgi:hypothetical protein
MTMIDHDFIRRVIKTTIIVTIFVALFTTSYYNIHFAFGLVIGSMWNIINFWLIRLVVVGGLSKTPIRKSKLLILILVKFPLLYGLGYLIVRFGKFTAGSLLCGFSLLFIVLLLKTLGILILTKNKESSSIRSIERKR